MRLVFNILGMQKLKTPLFKPVGGRSDVHPFYQHPYQPFHFMVPNHGLNPTNSAYITKCLLAVLVCLSLSIVQESCDLWQPIPTAPWSAYR